jgi:glucosamine--fructose-6-phosphate aminotransferase (isomerizing)
VSADAPGAYVTAEIAEQPQRWRDVIASAAPGALRAALACEPVVLIGSGSSAFVAELAARMCRRSGIAAWAIAATDAPFDEPPFVPATAIAFSQSGRSADVLAALDRFAPARCVAVTNDPGSPLAARAHVVVDVGAGRERAVPATKSVTATLACVQLAAAADPAAERHALARIADAVERWLAEAAAAESARVVPVLAAATSVIVAGSGDGGVAAREIALKFKEAAYVRAEGVAAGEFRHGGIALLDASCALLLLADAADPAQPKLAAAAATAGAAVVTLEPGDRGLFGRIVAGQTLAVATGRTMGVDGDAPRGIAKVVG